MAESTGQAHESQGTDPSRFQAWLRRLSDKLWLRLPKTEEKPALSPTRDQFEKEVFPSETEYVQARRQVTGDARDGIPADATPSVNHQLMGLALSGGGIRSATFCLGVLQALDRRGLFKFVDYLSTVSGGGFLGCSLSTLMSQYARDKEAREKDRRQAGEQATEPEADSGPVAFPFSFSESEDEQATVSYLRNNSNYLAPRGPLDYLRIFAVLVRGIILNFLVLLPFLLVSSMVVTVIYGQTLLDRLQEDQHRQRVAQLLERNWTGVEASEPIAGLLDALDAQSMIDAHRGMTREHVVRWLRGEARRRNAVRSATLPPLIRGSGDDYGKYTFRNDVTTDDLVERLWTSGTLRDLDTLREVDAVELAVRSSPEWVPGSLRTPPNSGLKLRDLFRTLHAEEILRREIGPAEFVEALDAGSLVACTATGRCRSDDLDSWTPSGQKPRLRRALQHLYERGMYDPQWLDKQTRLSPFAPPLAYWQAYELGVLERELLEVPELGRDPVDLDLFFREAFSRGMLHPEPEEASKERFLTSIRGRVVDELVVISPLGNPVQLRGAEVRVSEDRNLHEILHELWDEGALSRTWFEEHFPDHAPAYLGQLDKLAEIAAQTPAGEDEVEPAPLPGTRYLLRVGLLWILLYPLVLTFRRASRLLATGAHFAAAGLTLLLLAATGFLVYLVLFADRTALLTNAGLEGISELAPLFDTPEYQNWGLLAVASVLVLALGLLVTILTGDLRRLALGASASRWRDLYERSFSLVIILLGLVALVELQPYIIFGYHSLQAGHIWWSLGIGAASLLATMVAGPALAAFENVGKKVVMTIVALLGPLLPALVYVHLVLWLIKNPYFYDSVSYRLDEASLILAFLTLALLVHLLNLPIDVNSTSLHGFYRDRLSRAFLIRAEGDLVVPESDLSLTQICADGSGAPYHLINSTLNLQGARDPRLRRRRGDFFYFSRDFVGCKRTGYCATADLETVFPHLQTSSAMAVSAAAAAPNMGGFTSGPLVVLMALLNIRLGFWLPNPLRVNLWVPALTRAGSRAWRRLRLFAASLLGSFRSRPGAYLLLKEMLSLMHGDSRLVNLSDGGHMENTGVFELLRRRCQFIIACDAEADPRMRFGGLAALIRYARIDLGIEIALHTDDLRLDDEEESRQHCSIGFIRYPATDTTPSEVGLLLYIKSSITGDEDEVVAEYRGRSPSFPHESTADQFFDEGQFEAYRSLGYHICDGLFDELDEDVIGSFDECSEWFESLTVSLSPGLGSKVPFADIQSEMSNIERMLREPEYSEYFYEIYPELDASQRETPVLSEVEQANRFRNVFHLANIQLQLMQSVFVSTELGQKAKREHPSNRGWMNLFRRWAKAPSFRRAYLASITTYSAPFQQFCRAALGLAIDFEWSLVGDEEPGADSAGKRRWRVSLSASAPGTEAIRIGKAVVISHGADADVESFSLRAGYQGAGMRARAAMALRHWADERRMVLGSSETAAVATVSEFDHQEQDPREGE